jgi:beta-galactosidase
MHKTYLTNLLLIISLIFISTNFTLSGQRIEVSLNNNWKFIKGNFSDASNVKFNDSTWERVNLPYSWNSLDGQDGGTYYRGPAWYRKTFYLSKDYTGKKIFIKFGAANQVADVYVNGKFAGEHKGGYAAFTFDITGLLYTGKANVISVKVDNTSFKDSKDFQIAPLQGDFTMGGGINRSVKLIITDSVHVMTTKRI